jgi:hypothetical protein
VAPAIGNNKIDHIPIVLRDVIGDYIRLSTTIVIIKTTRRRCVESISCMYNSRILQYNNNTTQKNKKYLVSLFFVFGFLWLLEIPFPTLLLLPIFVTASERSCALQ